MCNFVPGQAVAIGPISVLGELGPGLPGDLGPVVPLVSEIGEVDRTNDLAKFGTVILKTDPGLEVHAVSRLSARLAAAIERKDAVVDLNHILPLSAQEPLFSPSLRLTPHAEAEALSIRKLLRAALPQQTTPIRVAVLDSGLAPDFAAHRNVRYLDYSSGGKFKDNADLIDPLGHGTRVVSILDRILPPEVSLSVGRLPSNSSGLTALTVAQALGDIIARELPQVVNLSVAPRNDWFVCPECRQRVAAPTFLSTLLPLIVRLGGKSSVRTITVMAAGNTGQISNSRWLTDDIDTLLIAVAQNRRYERARYSSAPEGPLADLFSVGAFGGDDPSDPDAQGVFLDGVHGTSFAAPFVSSVALLTKHFPDETDGFPTPIGFFTNQVIEGARVGRMPRHFLNFR